jgi:hypothetical protein
MTNSTITSQASVLVSIATPIYLSSLAVRMMFTVSKEDVLKGRGEAQTSAGAEEANQQAPAIKSTHE